MYAVFTGTILLILPLDGFCLDRFGRRRFFSSAFFFYVQAMLVFSQSTDLHGFYLARFLQGIGASLMWV
jgi:MFS family permease